MINIIIIIILALYKDCVLFKFINNTFILIICLFGME